MRDTSAITPATGGGVRLAFTTEPSDRVFRLRLTSSSPSVQSYSVSLDETTVYSVAWSTNGSYDTYYSLQNTTDADLTATLSLARADGAAAGSTTLTIPARTTASTNTAALATPRGATGTARLTHDGPPGALLPAAAIAGFSTTPAYVQPVKFETVRERR